MEELLDEKKELEDGFMYIMESYQTSFIDNGLSMDNFNKPNIAFKNLETKRRINTADYFEYTNKVEMLLRTLLQKYKKSNTDLESFKKLNTKLHTKLEELMSFNGASTQMKSDAIFNYSKNNINIFNYLVGSIFCFYIIHNL